MRGKHFRVCPARTHVHVECSCITIGDVNICCHLFSFMYHHPSWLFLLSRASYRWLLFASAQRVLLLRVNAGWMLDDKWIKSEMWCCQKLITATRLWHTGGMRHLLILIIISHTHTNDTRHHPRYRIGPKQTLKPSHRPLKVFSLPKELMMCRI